MGQSNPQRRYTPEEYFVLEASSEERHEYFDGEVFAMAGGTKSHNLITQNFTSALRAGLHGKSCQVFSNGVLTEVARDAFYNYPDVVVTCGPADRRDPLLVRQPVLIVEVLSPSTADYDRSRKFMQYQKIASLRHYLLLSQTAWVLEWFRRDEAGQWIYMVFSDPADVLEIAELNLRLPLADVYEDTDVAPLAVVEEPAGPRW